MQCKAYHMYICIQYFDFWFLLIVCRWRAHIHDSLKGIIADESFLLPTEANQIRLTNCKSMLTKLKSLSEESSTFCTWLVNQLQQISSESFSEATSYINRENYGLSFINFRYISTGKMDLLFTNARLAS